MYLIVYMTKDEQCPAVINAVEIPSDKVTWAKNRMIAYNRSSDSPYIAELTKVDDTSLVAWLYRNREYDITEYATLANKLSEQINAYSNTLSAKIAELTDCFVRKTTDT